MSLFKRFNGWLAAPSHRMTVQANEPIGTHIQAVTLALPDQERADWSMGSYIQPMIGGYVPRMYSVAEATSGSCKILVSRSGHGVGARYFSRAKPGDQLKVFGPFSDFPYHAGTGRSKMFLATGTGIAPFRRMVDEARREKLPAMLVFGAPEEADLAYHDYFRSLSGSSEFRYMPVLSRPSPAWRGERGYLTNHLSIIPEPFLKGDTYICGVPDMVREVKRALLRYGVPRSRIQVQKYG